MAKAPWSGIWKEIHLDVFRGTSEVPVRYTFKNPYEEICEIAGGGLLVQSMRGATLNIKKIGKLKVTNVLFKDEPKGLIICAKPIEEDKT